MKKLNPCFEQVSEENWIKNESRYWIHGATNALETAELEQWLFHNPQHSKIEQSSVLEHYNTWVNFMDENGVYLEFAKRDLPKPK